MALAATLSLVVTGMFISPSSGKLTKHEEALFEPFCGHHGNVVPAALLKVKWAVFL